MKIPKHIWIKGEKWKIFLKKDLKDDDGNVVYGLCDFDKKEIFVEKDLAKDKTMFIYTLVHEINHAAIHELHVEMDNSINEIVVDGLAFILTNVFELKFK